MIFWPKKNVYAHKPSSAGKGFDNKRTKSNLMTEATKSESIELHSEKKESMLL